ncbi:hypothetical protein [Oceanobacillus timonensis]|uniref:hypothetical protein n=1 Tax=Oceanobacillus timonensis TaxID=1926285 RepID=UPI0009BB8953|nr:hypothetical protein [Oceanobacillus timonensis]
MLNKLSEDYFASLRGPLESGRQRPESLSAMLILAIFLQALFLFLEFYIGRYSSFPHIQDIFKIHLSISCILAVLSIIYVIPYIRIRNQKFQYTLSIFVSQNLFGVSAYVLLLTILGTEESNVNIGRGSLLTFTYTSLILAFLIFTVTFIRFFILLSKGYYKKGAKKGETRQKYEKKTYLPLAVISSVGLLFITQFLIRNYGLENMDVLIMIMIAIVIFYTMLFVLPEQLVILYCKYRFDSFNYDEDGNLKPMGNDRKDT